MKRIKVLHIVHSLGMGGAETWLLQMVKYWHHNKHRNIVQVDLLITSGKSSILDADILGLGSEIFYVELNREKNLSFIKKYRAILKNGNYDAIHDHQDCLSGWHFLAGFGLLPKIRITHVHNPAYQLSVNYGTTFRRRAQLKYGRYLIKKFTTHIGGTSMQILEEYGFTSLKYPRQWIGSLHCAFDLQNWSGERIAAKKSLCLEFGIAETSKIILFVGRFDSSLDIGHPKNHKNSVFALNIFNELSDARIYFLMAGENSHIKGQFEALIEDKGLKDKVYLIGIRKDIQRLMLGADLLLFPSRAEGLGMVAVEAQAAGLPVLASTAVPKECVVINELVYFCKLDAPINNWVNQIENILRINYTTPSVSDPRWNDSAFNIEKCCSILEKIYKHENT